jgi:hypothetical protein
LNSRSFTGPEGIVSFCVFAVGIPTYGPVLYAHSRDESLGLLSSNELSLLLAEPSYLAALPLGVTNMGLNFSNGQRLASACILQGTERSYSS